MKKKILVMYARYGSGHKAIAEYVATYIKTHNDYEVKIIDITDYGNGMAKFTVKLMDFILNKHQELLFNVGYELANHKIATIANNFFVKKIYGSKKLQQEIVSFDPDITISSHFYCSNLITYYNKLGLINSKLFTIITDYRAHEFWIRNKNLEDGYIVGNKIVKEELIKKGIQSKKIYPFGLPLNITKISNLDNEEDIYKRYKLKNHQKVYLFFGGSSSGSMYYFNYFKAITKINLDATVIFICGKNAQLKKKCDAYVKENHLENMQVLGYSNDVLNLMKISDLVISKPGGATVTECMEMKVPMLLIPGIGGQEKYNARFLVRKKYGVKVRSVWGFKKAVKNMQKNPTIIKKMHERLNNLDNNESVIKINNLIRNCK